MDWIIVNTNDDLKKLDESVCWEDSKSVEYHATIRNSDYFPNDISRSGYQNKNIFLLIDTCSAPEPFLEMVFIDCDHYSQGFLDHPFMLGRVDILKRVEIENEEGSMMMHCSRLIYRFLSDEDLRKGLYYRIE